MTNNKHKEIMEREKAYPDAYRLARKFHNLYEEFAPKFGYETRGDTKEFDPSSPNGRTMAYVCKTIVDEEVNTVLQGVVERVEKMEKPMYSLASMNHPPKPEYVAEVNGYNQAIQDVFSLLNDQIISNEEKK